MGDMQEAVEQVVADFLETGRAAVHEGTSETSGSATKWEEGSIEAEIMELLEERVKPFVQQDGGDLQFDRFDRNDGTLYLLMQGSCSGCAQSHVTLHENVQNLMQHYIPEVKQIVGLSEEEEPDLPRPGR